jgi:hypothetical protein
MSLNRGVAALGAVAVVGAATLGWSIPLAVHFGQPKPLVSVTAGSYWTQFAPLCWNNGDKLTPAQISACSDKLVRATTGTGAPTIPIAQNSTFMINTTKEIASKGWFAKAGQSSDLVALTHNQQVGNLPGAAATVSAQGAPGPVVVIEGDGQNTVYGVWAFTLKQQDT